MPDFLDALDLGGGRRLVIVPDGDGLAALPHVGDVRARPGDGAAEALLTVLARRSKDQGRFTIHSWSTRTATGERAIGVDQTNESVIVGATAVVKWATHLEAGPHPAPHRITTLREAGFTGMPTPWGLITWRSPDGDETLVASVDEYLPGAVDGWTWAVELITRAVLARDPGPVVEAATAVGILVADLHTALASTTTTAAPEDAQRWHEDAMGTLDIACASGDSASITTARTRRHEIATILGAVGTLGGTPVLDGHGDLHVGQVLRSGHRFVVTDFDGNPVLPARQRMLPIPAALDVAGMTQSLAHAAVVARKYTDLDPDILAEVDAAARAAFLDGYAGELDHTVLRAFRLQQVLREIIYAARHLPRWMYVPDAALPALLDERSPL